MMSSKCILRFMTLSCAFLERIGIAICGSRSLICGSLCVTLISRCVNVAWDCKFECQISGGVQLHVCFACMIVTVFLFLGYSEFVIPLTNIPLILFILLMHHHLQPQSITVFAPKKLNLVHKILCLFLLSLAGPFNLLNYLPLQD